MTDRPTPPERLHPAPPAAEEVPLAPARIVNEWVYCPRLAYLMWVEGEWADTGDTEDGRRTHARVDRGGGRLPPPPSRKAETDNTPQDEDTAVPFRSRSVTLSSERLGAIAKMDVIEGRGDLVTPVDFKRGRRPHVAEGAYEPERAQVCLQALILEDNGYRVEEGALWFAASRERVRVRLDEELRARTLQALADLKLAAAARHRPPPLENSPKCPRCALAGICLPDEVNFFRVGQPPRMLNPADDTALPLHVQVPGARVRKTGEQLLVETEEGARRIPLMDVSELALYGPVSVTTPALHELMRRSIPVSWHSTGGWLLGHTIGVGTRGVETRVAQFRIAADPLASHRIAAGLVAAKIRNQRTMLRRNWKGEDADGRDRALIRLSRLILKTAHLSDTQVLLGVEGEAAAIYFGLFERLLSTGAAPGEPFTFRTRNRRPPTDPVNAMLSFTYALAVRLFSGALAAVGFDPGQGFFHRLRPGRPALALDMMEPFRPILCDSTVLTAINNGEVQAADFAFNGLACALKPGGRRALITAWERRLDQETTHPIFGYRVSMRRLIAVQCRLLARHVTGEISEMPHYVPR